MRLWADKNAPCGAAAFGLCRMGVLFGAWVSFGKSRVWLSVAGQDGGTARQGRAGAVGSRTEGGKGEKKVKIFCIRAPKFLRSFLKLFIRGG